MKKSLIGCLLIVCAISLVLPGCTSMSKKPQLVDHGSMFSQPMQINFRPNEYGAEDIGYGAGEVVKEKVLGFAIGKDAPYIRAMEGNRVFVALSPIGIVFLGMSRPKPVTSMEMIASNRAIESKNGDAFYLLSTEVDKNHFLWFVYSKETCRVSGRVLKLIDFGPIGAERADELAKQQSDGGSATAAPAKKRGGLLGWLTGG